MKLVILTPEINIKNEQEMVISMLVNGTARVHVRKPGFSNKEYREYLGLIPEYFYERLVVHDHFELFWEYGLGGIHFRAAARSDEAALRLAVDIPCDRISTSFHSWEEIEQNEVAYSYLFVSPAFDSISKQGYKAAIDLSGAQRTKEQLASAGRYCPDIFGLGGVGPDQIHILRENGFDGAAMLGAIWSSADPLGTYLEAVRAATGPAVR